MRILFTTPFVPYPPIEGGRMLPYRYLEGLSAQGHEITVLLALRRPEDPANVARIEEFGRVRALKVRARPLWAVALDALRHNESVRVRRHAFRAIERELAALLREEPFDVVCLESLFSAYLAPIVRRVRPEARVVVLEQNVESRLFRRLVESRGGGWKVLGSWESRRIERAEREAARQADAVVTLSDEDAAALHELEPGVRTAVVRPGIRVFRGERIGPPPDRGTVLFLGSYHWPPNRDGIAWFIGEIWPAVRAARPEARLVLAGNDPEGLLPGLADQDRGIHALGFVEDVDRALREATVSVVPIRFGSGIRLKILESLANERPVVTTSRGLEGLPFEDGRHVLVADEPAAFARSVVSLLEDPPLAATLAAEGRAAVEAEFSWKAATDRLGTALERIVDDS